ncbi:hypothetical protein Pelo_17371 [Pelomyxa schiedti]|nr:hypothetical protein Pelo_17371 [Pelomyxa schiedti]
MPPVWHTTAFNISVSLALEEDLPAGITPFPRCGNRHGYIWVWKYKRADPLMTQLLLKQTSTFYLKSKQGGLLYCQNGLILIQYLSSSEEICASAGQILPSIVVAVAQADELLGGTEMKQEILEEIQS